MTGGGTLGPVTPLIALAEAWCEEDASIILSWVGTSSGPEKKIIKAADIPFISLSTPKLDRHNKWKWIFIAPHLLFSIVNAYRILKKIKPDIIFTAGGYVSVPVVIAGKLQGIPSWVHQLDVAPGIANKIMAYFANHVSITWKESAEGFGKRRTELVGSLVRKELSFGSGERVKRANKFDQQKPTVFVFGGGTGAQAINENLLAARDELLKEVNIIHITGCGKGSGEEKFPQGYIARELVNEEMADFYAAADVVVARAGMGTLLELSSIGKPAILIPIQGTDQELNAALYEKAGGAIVIRRLNPQILKQEIIRLANNRSKRSMIGSKARNVFQKNGAKAIIKMVKGE